MTAQEYSILQPILNSDSLNKRYGRKLTEAEKQAIRFRYCFISCTNNYRKRHGLPMYRRVHLTNLAYRDANIKSK